MGREREIKGVCNWGVLRFIKASLVHHVHYRRKTRTRDTLQGNLLQSYLPLGLLSRLAVNRSRSGKASALLGNNVALQFSIIIILNHSRVCSVSSQKPETQPEWV